MFVMTLPPSTSGEPAAPKNPLRTPNRSAVSTSQSGSPVSRLTAESRPCAPNVKTRPPATTGTERGPSSNPKSSR